MHILVSLDIMSLHACDKRRGAALLTLLKKKTTHFLKYKFTYKNDFSNSLHFLRELCWIYIHYITAPPNSPFPNGLGKKNNEIKKGCFVSNIFMFRNIII